MTKSEAIKLLKDLAYERDFENTYNRIKEIAAINMAIEAIESCMSKDLSNCI